MAPQWDINSYRARVACLNSKTSSLTPGSSPPLCWIAARAGTPFWSRSARTVERRTKCAVCRPKPCAARASRRRWSYLRWRRHRRPHRLRALPRRPRPRLTTRTGPRTTDALGRRAPVIIGGAAGAGAGIGAIAKGKKGAAVGAAIGAATGAAYELMKKDKQN